MNALAHPFPTRARRGAYRTGWILSGLVIAFLLLDAALKLLAVPQVLDACAALGFHGTAIARGLGTLLLAVTALYAAPRTAPLGALLLTAYLGGAVAVHLRAGNPLFTHVLFGAYVGVLAWAGLCLREPRLRALLAPRDRTQT